MSIARLRDTFTLRKADGKVYERVTRMTANKVAMGDRTYTAAEALEIALALVTAATGTIVRRTVTGKLASYDIKSPQSTVTLNPAEALHNEGYYGAWAVGDILQLLGNSAFQGLACESNELLTHQFSFLTDEEAQEISEYIAKLMS